MKMFVTVSQVFVASVCAAYVCLAAAQQPYPNKPIRIITPYAPGGSTSVMARLIGQKLTEDWGQQVLVDNRPGGNGFIGGEALVRSAPDGYTLMLITSTYIMTPLLIAPPYDAINDVAPVATLSNYADMLVVHPSLPANTLQEFIALAKSQPGKLNYASSGTGGSTHLSTELLSMLAGIKMQHIPYKGAGQSLTDLIGGQVQVLFTTPINVLPHIMSGKLKAIAVSGETRLAALPQVPTFAEAGLPGYDVKGWNAILAPAGTPKNIVERLSVEIGKIVRMPEIKERFDSMGVAPFVSTPEQFGAMMKAETAKWAKVIKTANIKLEN